MKQGLVQEQTLKLKMNQSLLQSIHILQLSSTDLLEYVKKIAEENPLIEHIDDNYDFTQWYSSSTEQISIGEINAASLTMYDQLRYQLFTLDIPKEIKPIVEYGIDSLDENGYLDTDLQSWAENCSTSVETVKVALDFIQSLEPEGIGARSLVECILLQLKQMQHNDVFLEDLLKHHLEWIADQNSAAISDKYWISEEYAKDIIEHIKRCHPKPRQLLACEKTEHIIPEASIYKENESWKISFHEWSAPTVKVNNTYKEQMKTLDNETADYLREKYREIDSLNQAIHYRTNTLERVIKIIIEHQVSFLENGPRMLQMLTLQELADKLNLHASTISRSINNKHVQTPHGLLPIKFFLQSGIKQENGQQMAAHAIKHLISQLIETENKQKPLSDEAIKKYLLNEHGISIARRTIMKYRKQLSIPSSIKRKDKKTS